MLKALGTGALASLRFIWRLMKDISGETSLENKLHNSCHCQKEAVKKAWTEQFGGIHRCC
jgi:hypothetical protein